MDQLRIVGPGLHKIAAAAAARERADAERVELRSRVDAAIAMIDARTPQRACPACNVGHRQRYCPSCGWLVTDAFAEHRSDRPAELLRVVEHGPLTPILAVNGQPVRRR